MRASWFEFDAPQHIALPEWLLYKAISFLRLPKEKEVQTYRLAERAPAPQSLRGALDNEGFVYQFAARASALVFVLVSVTPPPSVSCLNRVMFIGVSTRALEVCGMK